MTFKPSFFISAMIAFSVLWGQSSLGATDIKNTSAMSSTAIEKQSNNATISGPININKATLEEFKTIKGLGQTKAQAIITYREKNGPFAQITDLQKVPGIGPKIFEKIQSELSLN